MRYEKVERESGAQSGHNRGPRETATSGVAGLRDVVVINVASRISCDLTLCPCAARLLVVSTLRAVARRKLSGPRDKPKPHYSLSLDSLPRPRTVGRVARAGDLRSLSTFLRPCPPFAAVRSSGSTFNLKIMAKALLEFKWVFARSP